MGETIRLDTPDAHSIGAYLAKPAGKPRGGIVVVQEIFGVTPHIRAVADGFAAHGYTALAPAFFDFLKPDVVLDYDRSGVGRGKRLAQRLGMDRPIDAVAAAARAIAAAGQTGVVGYCWGGTVALLSAQQLGLPAVSYYGARNVPFLGQPLSAPCMFHFGARDHSIPPEAVQAHRDAYPDAPVYVYPNAGHAFNRDIDPTHYDPVGGPLALERTLAFFASHLTGGA